MKLCQVSHHIEKFTPIAEFSHVFHNSRQALNPLLTLIQLINTTAKAADFQKSLTTTRFNVTIHSSKGGGVQWINPVAAQAAYRILTPSRREGLSAKLAFSNTRLGSQVRIGN
jgi:hypothetical protein